MHVYNDCENECCLLHWPKNALVYYLERKATALCAQHDGQEMRSSFVVVKHHLLIA